MQTDKAWDVQRGSPEVTIGILDTGVDFFHQDLLDNIWVNPGEDLDADGVVWDVDDLDGEDSDGNGLVDDLVEWTFTTLSPGDNYPYPDTLQSDYQHGTMMAWRRIGKAPDRFPGIAPGPRQEEISSQRQSRASIP